MPMFKRVAHYIATGDYETLAKKREWGRRRMAEWRAKNLDQARALDRARYRRDKPKRQALNRRLHLKRKFSLTVEQYGALLAAQGGGCAICRKRQKINHLHVDHDHATGAVRAILCASCNQGVGWFERIGLDAIQRHLSGRQVT